MSHNFKYADFYRVKAMEAAQKLAASAAAYAANPCGDTAVRLKMDAESWADYNSAWRATDCHKL